MFEKLDNSTYFYCLHKNKINNCHINKKFRNNSNFFNTIMITYKKLYL